MAYFTNDKDRKVKVFSDGVAVSSSNAQSEYSRFLNFKGNFTISTNTISNDKVYDIEGLGYAIPQEGGTAAGTDNRPLNFNDSHFDITETVGTPGSYDISSTGWTKVNSFTVKPLNIINATGNEAVTAAEGANTINLTFNNDETDVYRNGTKITTLAPRSLNFDTGFTVTDDSTNDRVNISGNFLTNPMTKKWGAVFGAQADLSGNFGDGLFAAPYTSPEGNVSGVNDATHGHARRYSTSGSDNDVIRVVIPNLTRLTFNPHLYLKMRFVTMDDTRFYLGFNSGDIPTGSNTYLDDLNGFGLSYQYDTAETEDTVLYINRNNAGASETKVSTTQSLTNTTPFTIELVGDSANNKWGWNYNGGAFTYYSTTGGLVPAATTDLNFTFSIEQIASGPATIDYWYFYLTQDK